MASILKSTEASANWKPPPYDPPQVPTRGSLGPSLITSSRVRPRRVARVGGSEVLVCGGVLAAAALGGAAARSPAPKPTGRTTVARGLFIDSSSLAARAVAPGIQETPTAARMPRPDDRRTPHSLLAARPAAIPGFKDFLGAEGGSGVEKDRGFAAPER